jgi:ABC-type Fe3+/spermidine/putrescine transport system ATPase subunit
MNAIWQQTVLQLAGVHVRFKHETVLRGVTLAVNAGEFFSVLGPSGAGKTTLLRVIAGLIKPDIGSVAFGDLEGDRLPPHRRPVAMVPQSYGLFPHLTVAGNVLFPLRSLKVPERRQNEAVHEILSSLQIGDLDAKKPAQLSGGQQQRVALARSFARVISLESQEAHAVLLLDEPFSAADRLLRLRLQDTVKQFMSAHKCAVVYVTHDQTEAAALSDRVAIICDGRIIQCGSPRSIYTDPASAEVTRFLGLDTVFQGEVVCIDTRHAQIRLKSGEIVFCHVGPKTFPASVHLFVPPLSLTLLSASAGTNAEAYNRVQVHLHQVTYCGQHSQVLLKLTDGKLIQLLVSPDVGEALRPGVSMALQWPVSETRLISPEDQGNSTTIN